MIPLNGSFQKPRVSLRCLIGFRKETSLLERLERVAWSCPFDWACLAHLRHMHFGALQEE